MYATEVAESDDSGLDPDAETLTLGRADGGGGDSVVGPGWASRLERRSEAEREGSSRWALAMNFRARVRSPDPIAPRAMFRHFSASSLFPSITKTPDLQRTNKPSKEIAKSIHRYIDRGVKLGL